MLSILKEEGKEDDMNKRQIKKTGEWLSILGYGGMRFPTKLGKIDEEKAMAQLRYAIDQGVNYIDTAYFYHGGQSESFIGRALEGGYREKVYIATKLPPWLVHSEADMSRILDTQLERLKTQTIDFYLLHALNQENWDRFLSLNVFQFLEEKKAAGKIRNIGFSFHGDRALFKTIIDAYDWSFCQIQYNFLDEYHQAGKEGLAYASAKDIAVFVMEPLRGGTLAVGLPQEATDAYIKANPKRSPVEWALKWIWQHEGVTTVLSGMTEDQHVYDNIAYAKSADACHLSNAENQTMDAVKAIYKAKQKVPCTACQYCMPCPFGVDIPRCFELYNAKYLLNQKVKTFYWMQLGGINGKPSHASLCVRCGKCLPLCPQGIKIPEALDEVAVDLEGHLMKPFVKTARWVLEKRNTRRSK